MNICMTVSIQGDDSMLCLSFLNAASNSEVSSLSDSGGVDSPIYLRNKKNRNINNNIEVDRHANKLNIYEFINTEFIYL